MQVLSMKLIGGQRRTQRTGGCLTQLSCFGRGATTVWVSLGIIMKQIRGFRCVDKRSVHESVYVHVCTGVCVYEVPSQMAAVNCTVLTRTTDEKHIDTAVARTPVLLELHARACKNEIFKRAHMFTQSKHTSIHRVACLQTKARTHARRPNRST